jgi:hypothetical protein
VAATDPITSAEALEESIEVSQSELHATGDGQHHRFVHGLVDPDIRKARGLLALLPHVQA